MTESNLEAPLNVSNDQYQARGPIDIRLVKDIKTSPKLLAIHAANALFSAGEAILTYLLVGYMVEDVVQRKPPSALVMKITLVGIILTTRALLNVSLYSRLLTLKQNVARELSSVLLGYLCNSAREVAASPLEAGIASSQGIIEMSSYVSQYLADVLLALVVSPAAFFTLLIISPKSSLLVAATLITVPPLMVLLGKLTLKRAQGRLEAINYLSGRFLDLMTGLPTLRGLGLARARSLEIREASENYRKETSAGLRIALLSGAALDLLGTLATAFVAINVGGKLLHHGISIHYAVTSILLVPAIYAPLRTASSQFHATSDARLATERFYKIVRDSSPSQSFPSTLDSAVGLIEVRQLNLTTDREANGPRRTFTFVIPTKGLVCIEGPSGSGKSTLLRTLSGAIAPLDGEIDYAQDLRMADFGYLPQEPQLLTGTIFDNLTITAPSVSQIELEAAVKESRLEQVLADNYWSLATPLSENGIDLSAGERQRLVIARILLQDKRIYLLDEPTANLDKENELQVLAALIQLSTKAAVVVVTHSEIIKSHADYVISTLPSFGFSHD